MSQGIYSSNILRSNFWPFQLISGFILIFETHYKDVSQNKDVEKCLVEFMEPNKETQNGFFEKLSIDNFLLGIVSADFMFIENGLRKKLQKKIEWM